MKKYFAILDDDDRRGPFGSMQEPINLIKQISRDRGYTEDEAEDFFNHRSAIEQEDILAGKTDCVRMGWQAREEYGCCETSSYDNTFKSESDI